MAEVGFVWGATNYPALRHWFSTGLKSGITAETFRTMVDRFAARPQQIQESGLAPWKAFLARREQLRLGSLKQATGLTQTATQPLSDDSEWTPERYEVEHGAEAERQSAYWASLDDGIEWTPERYAAEHEAEEARQKAFWDSQDDGIDWTPERYAAEHETEHTRQRSLQDSWSL